tara:strand:- start:200 stop:472 length:273 start_codon:yes stop_codon:yes gene_type:complete
MMIISNSDFIELTCNLSRMVLDAHFQYNDEQIIVEEEGGTRYTEKAQQVFDGIYDDVEGYLTTAFEIEMSDNESNDYVKWTENKDSRNAI